MKRSFIFSIPESKNILREEQDKLEFLLDIPETHTYQMILECSAKGSKSTIRLYLNGDCMGDYNFRESMEIIQFNAAHLNLNRGKNLVELHGRYGEVVLRQVSFVECEPKSVTPVRGILVNPSASEEAKRLMKFLSRIYGSKIITGQHTKTVEQAELWHIQSITGKLPALCGFDFLGDSPNIDWENSDNETLTEARENQGTVETALEWAEKYKGIVSYCWHWFSPKGGRNKSFYTENTDFDLKAALQDGTPENAALISDMDAIAEQLKVFRDKRIPVLWRPLHEAEGTWFWWGAHGPGPCKKLWRIMYERFTNHHGLDNLIWVWNSCDPGWYPGDDCVDIISTDFYAPAKNYGPLKGSFDMVNGLNDKIMKMIALGESGPIPDPEKAISSGATWLWYMTWCGSFCTSEDWTDNQHLIKCYASPYTITLDQLPEIY
mgnify:CR=1 FL=1